MAEGVGGIRPAAGIGLRSPDWAAISDIIFQVRGLPAATPPARDELERLACAWGNPDFQAGVGYLSAVCEHACTTSAGLLECGSGLTTLVIGLLLEKRPEIEACSLEHDESWFRFIQDVLQEYGVRSIMTRHGRLEEHEAYAWYTPKPPDPERISLVVCDGPPGSTHGGRYGVVPEMYGRFTPDVTILLDDAHREGERETMRAWADGFGFGDAELHLEDDGVREFAVIRLTP